MAQVPTNIRPERAAPFLVVLWVTKSRPVSLYTEWVGGEPDPRELLRPFPPELMTMWPVSTRVNTPKNDDPDLLVPFVEASADAPPDGNSA
jgi:putative SOS response-associated peptidase YedK